VTTGSEEVTSPSVVRGDDAYHLTPDGIKEPPKGWGPSLRYFGPGLILSASIVGSGELIVTTPPGPARGWGASLRLFGPGLLLSASIVGSGELIATTTLGAQAGFAILWMVIFSTLVKVAVQVEFARWTISTGQPALTGYNKVPPRIGPLGWVNALWSVMALTKILQIGGIVGGVAIAFSVLLPLGGDPLGFTSTLIWTIIVVVVSIALLYSNRYGLIERGAVLLVVVFSTITVLIALGLPFTPFAYS